ncbi:MULTISPECIES: GntR family transcriptional regulator YhfZ [unclassified Streptomyces]|uniref:GntR family transcriptional regulator YhfZ n=1 Tax=unclassified Streptomyces TaxID=2593676 RepID=UPI001BE7CE50|nr:MULTISPECIES: GntR family transcriptional regulator YhfZ [unclassified Streptomyces]MBT2405775.1 GntR family transcriptional regulator [Streptomyces sp. ISL-21]MBT2608231.1 GntR family transcriptional regulator [Streptomyces sp. ISL-87]
MNGFDDRLLTRNGLAARQLAALLLNHEPDTRLPRVRDFAEELGVGNGTVQAALALLEESRAIETTARGHLGTFLVRSDRGILWRLSGLGTLLAAMPLPHSRRYEGLATGLRTAFEAAGAPFAITFMRGAAARTAALAEGKVHLAVLSRFAADRVIAEQPVELIADLGPSTYVGGHGLVLRRGVAIGSPGLRVAVNAASQEQPMLARRAFAGRDDIRWIEASPLRLRELFDRGKADATVWNLDEVEGRLGEGVEVQPLGDEAARELSLRHSSAAIIGRTEGARALAAVRGALDLSLITDVQGQVLRGERVPAY